ncbi:hypothetical protein SAMN04488048_1204 [Trichococcus flocculiformis]|uniref:DUF3953 domain-containing protein n=1 Tax=Trichococcus shcherbakoviae TaxID=2094020 RepID=A0A383TH88_9LACT|nr:MULTISPECIES: hypothetical protein [Trichococcus]CZR07358.1 Hypothetical protein TES5_2405 [Trichococcus sp. ES5]SHF98283.1 hypothetical protein SAMN04488048_1204 [Trichococcus flocculiformis]SYZ79019.1 Hypothetical protein TART1_1843 [Trichococcus shcherbakoviae]
MQNTKILKITFGAVVLILSVYSLWTKDFTYQNIALFFLGLLMSVLGVEESKRDKDRRWNLYVFTAVVLFATLLLQYV